PDSTDRVCVERRVPKPRQPDDPCPQITPPSYKSIVFLLPFALCTAFPHSDYYESSALGSAHRLPSQLARFLPGGHCGSPACGRWSAPGTVKADLLMTPNRRRPVRLLGPLPPVALTGRAALQPPVENQQACEVNLRHDHLPRRHGAPSNPA
ncbi:hypothetical protein KXV85_000860, partial [Aspergillus fumigatus]